MSKYFRVREKESPVGKVIEASLGEKADLSHDHDLTYDGSGISAATMAAHVAAADPHVGYVLESGSITQITTRSHTDLTSIGTNAHTVIDTFIASKGAVSGLASLNGSSKVVEDPANATATPTASKIPIADGAGKLATGWIPDLTAAYPGLVIKTDTGDPGSPYEGMLVINTFDNNVKLYADGAYRTLASW